MIIIDCGLYIDVVNQFKLNIMKEYKLWLRIENLKPIKFYHYTSCTVYRILSQSFNYKTEEHDFLEELGNKLQMLIQEKGIAWDNKVVIECELDKNRTYIKEMSNIFIGKYDGRWSVGFGVWCDEWIKPIEIN